MVHLLKADVRRAGIDKHEPITRVDQPLVDGRRDRAFRQKGAFQELIIDWGPGYRVYVGKDGDKLIILLGGGTKKRQQKDIEHAQWLWEEYKQRKKG